MNKLVIYCPEDEIAELIEQSTPDFHLFMKTLLYRYVISEERDREPDVVIATLDYLKKHADEDLDKDQACVIALNNNENTSNESQGQELYEEILMYNRGEVDPELFHQIITSYNKHLIQFSHLPEARPFYQAVIDQIEPVIIVSDEGELLYMNIHAERLFRVRLRELAGESMEKVFIADLSADDFNWWQQIQFSLSRNKNQIKLKHISIDVPECGHNHFNITATSSSLMSTSTDNKSLELIKISFQPEDISFNSTEEQIIKDMAIDQSYNAVLITDADLENGPVIEFVNPSMERITGYDKSELLGKTPRILQGPDTDREMLADLKQTIAQGKPFTGRTVNYKKNGEPYYVEWQISPVTNNVGKTTHYLSIQRDITHEVEQKNELRYQAAIIEHASEAFITTDHDLNVLTWNEGAAQMLGVDSEVAIGSNLHEVIDDYELKLSSLVGEVINNGEATETGIGLMDVWDAWIEIDVSGFQLPVAAGGQKTVALILSDVTERVRAQRIIDEAAHVANIGAWEYNFQNGVVQLSRWITHFLEVSHSRISLEEFLEAFATHDGEKLKGMLETNQSGGESFETTLKTRSGYYVELSANNYHDKHNQMFRGIIRNVTEQRQVQIREKRQLEIIEQTARGDSYKRIFNTINTFVESEVKGASSVVTIMDLDRVQEVYTESIDGYREAVVGNEFTRDDGPCARAVFDNEPIYVTSIETDERFEKLKVFGEIYGFESCWSFPVEVGEQVIATLALYFYDSDRIPTEPEQQVINSCRHLCRVATERYYKDHNLLEAQQKLQKAQEIAGIGYWIFDVESNEVKFVSGEMNHMVGLALKDYDEGITEAIKSSIHPDDREEALRRFAQCRDEKSSFEYTYRFKGQDGKYLWIHSMAEYIEREGGDIIQGVSRDITREKKAEQQLLQSHEMWTQLVDTLPNPLLILEDGEILFLNPNAQRFLKIDDDMLDAPQEFKKYLFDEDSISKFEEFLDEVGSSGDDYIQLQLKTRQGGKKHAMAKAARITYEEKPAVQLVLSDITALIKYEEELRSSRRLLEDKVQERTEELEERNQQMTEEIARRRDIENKLIDMSFNFSTILEHTDQILILIDSRYQIQSFNKRANDCTKRIMGQRLEEGVDIRNYMNDGVDFGFDFQEELNHGFNGEVRSFDSHVKMADSDLELWLYISLQPIREHSESSPSRMLITAKDITKRKQIEQELFNSKKVIESINQHLSQGIFRSHNGQWVYANDGLLELLKYESREELLNNVSLTQLFVSSAEYYEMMRKLLKKGELEQFETSMYRKDGSEIDVLISVYGEWDEQNELSYIDGSISDITERKKAERQLAESEKQYRTLYENMFQGVVYHRPDGSIFEANDAACTILGLTRDQLMGKSSLDPDWRVVNAQGEPISGEEHPVMRSIEAKSEIKNAMIGVERPNSTDVRWLNVHAQPIFTDDGTMTHAFVTFEDITPLKEANRQIEEARRQTERTVKAKEQFFSTMSHEIRTPMNGIKGMSYLLNKTDLSKDQKDYVAAITSSSQNLLVIINDILDISKIESGKISFDNESFAIRQVVKQVVDMLSVQIEQKHLNIDYYVSEDVPPTLVGDSSRLNQVLFNLVGNAVKFTEEGEIHVTVSNIGPCEKGSRFDEIEHCRIKFEINDTGVGIPEDKQDIIFDQFTQVDNSLKRKYEGTGLGLNITKRLIELQGGNIAVESEAGVGSTFTVALPYEIDSKSEETGEELMDTSGLEGTDVLVVDDNKVNGLWLTKMMEAWEMNIHHVLSGKEAIEHCKEQSPDVILMDVQMPEMNGYETTEIIREEFGEHKNTPIIGITADVLSDQKIKCREAGMDSYLGKPFEPEDLVKLLRKYYLSQKR